MGVGVVGASGLTSGAIRGTGGGVVQQTRRMATRGWRTFMVISWVAGFGTSKSDVYAGVVGSDAGVIDRTQDRKSTRLNSSHSQISYAVFCLKKKKNKITIDR